MYKLNILPHRIICNVLPGSTLMSVLQSNRVFLDSPCGGNGTCKKCKVIANGKEVLACQTIVDCDMTVELPENTCLHVLQEGICGKQNINPEAPGYLLAFDIGTTSVVCFLLDPEKGTELAKSSMMNPQAAFGADVISRIQSALHGSLAQETEAIRQGMSSLIQTVCREAGITPEEIGVVSVVGNPAMQQIFLGICPSNLTEIPFAPVLTEAKTVPCQKYLSICPNALLLIVPDISGYIGADTMGCLLATELYQKEELTLLVDIGTNGELVLGNKNRMLACSTAAGPALEGANLQFGMRGTKGAIDHVQLENGRLTYSVIGNGEARGICGSGIIDAISAGLDMGLLNRRGRILNESHTFALTQHIYLTQDDIRQVQLAKGAIHAGISLMTKQLGLHITDIQKVLLAGAFGSHLNPKNACRIGLLPEELRSRIIPVGNAAGSGAKMLACDKHLLPLTQQLAKDITFIELANLDEFPKTFAKSMNFQEVLS